MTYKLGGFKSDDASSPVVIYDFAGTGRSDYYALDHRGYLYAKQAGAYTFNLAGGDEFIYVWTGPNFHKQYWYQGPITFTESYAP